MSSARPTSPHARFVERPDDILRFKATAHSLGISATTLWRWTRSGKFPMPIKLASGVVGWRRSVRDAWLACRELESVQAAIEARAAADEAAAAEERV